MAFYLCGCRNGDSGSFSGCAAAHSKRPDDNPLSVCDTYLLDHSLATESSRACTSVCRSSLAAMVPAYGKKLSAGSIKAKGVSIRGWVGG
jgi:hypothetical protein